VVEFSAMQAAGEKIKLNLFLDFTNKSNIYNREKTEKIYGFVVLIVHK
jgi:hypothetical protein